MQFIRRYPIPVPLLWVSLGIWMGDSLGWGFPLFLSGAALAWLACVFNKFTEIAFPLLLAFTGASRLALSTTAWSPHDLRQLVPATTTLASVRGRLLDTPITRMIAGSGKPRPFSRATVQVDELRTEAGDWIPAAGTLQVSVSGELPADYFAGQHFEISGALGVPASATTPGSFNYRAYLQRQGIYFELRTEGTDDWKQLPPPQQSTRPPFSDRFQAWGRRMLSLGFASPDSAIDLLCAMAIGWKPGLDPASQDAFMKSGTLHVFAISGLHIALIALIGLECLRLFGVPRPLAGFLAIPVIWLYTGLTGWQASAIRSAVMMSVVAGGWILNRPGNLMNNLAGAALALLCWDPQQLFQPGFQLSFCVVAHLGLLSSQAGDLLQGVGALEPYLPDRLQPRWRRYADRAIEKIKPHLATSAAAWVGSAPLMAHYFHVLSPVSLLANLIVVPLSSLALASCVASLALGAWFPSVAELFNHSSWLLMNLMLKSSILAAKIPGGWFYVPSPGWLGFLIYLTALVIYLGGWLEGSLRDRRVALGILFGLVVVMVGRGFYEGSGCRLTLISRRGGAVAWFDEGLGRHKWLMDPGDVRETQRVTVPFLQSEGINTIPNLILTHASIGQAGGADPLEESFTVHRRFVPRGNFRSPSFRKFVDRVRSTQLHLESVAFPGTFGCWEVLSPLGATRPATADDAALILRGTFDGCRILWLPRLSTHAQDQLLLNAQTARRLEADLVIAGMPTRGEPLPAPLLEKISPQWIVVLDAEYPASARATPELEARLQQSAQQVFFSSRLSTLEFKLRVGRLELIRASDLHTPE
jgi:competence protein ComEC